MSLAHLVARLDQVVLVVQCRARADDAHLPCQYVVDLRQLVQARLAQEGTAPGNVAVRIFQKVRGNVVRGVAAHRAELQDVKVRFALADAALLEKTGPGESSLIHSATSPIGIARMIVAASERIMSSRRLP